jgi:peptidoglycan/xylan/chitin deacetylase (PgdA/CDA1 family)
MWRFFMRVVIACALVVLSVLAALGLAQTQNVFSSVTGRIPGTSATAATSSAEPSPKAIVVAKDQERPTTTTLNMAVVATAPTASPVTTTPAAAAPAATTTSSIPAVAAPAQVAAAPAPATPAPEAAPTTKNIAPQVFAQAPAMAQPGRPAPAPAPAAAQPACPTNPNGLGVARTVEIDTTGGPGFGFEHFKQHDFLRPGEVVLTFDDGPWLNNTPAVLAALNNHCVKATFFPIGKHATYYPEILKQVAAAGNSIGSHTWGHVDLAKKIADMTKADATDAGKAKAFDEAKMEIELGISAVRAAVGDATTPFFRFPALRHPPELVTYLGNRGVAIFSTDFDSFDFKMRKADQVVRSVMERLKKHGKGIILMHDFQHPTAEAIPTILDQLKLNGYKVVHMRAKAPLKSLPEYDAMLVKEQKLPTVSSRPTNDIVKTVGE